MIWAKATIRKDNKCRMLAERAAQMAPLRSLATVHIDKTGQTVTKHVLALLDGKDV